MTGDWRPHGSGLVAGVDGARNRAATGGQMQPGTLFSVLCRRGWGELRAAGEQDAMAGCTLYSCPRRGTLSSQDKPGRKEQCEHHTTRIPTAHQGGSSRRWCSEDPHRCMRGWTGPGPPGRNGGRRGRNRSSGVHSLGPGCSGSAALLCWLSPYVWPDRSSPGP
jgi:hypothetical protein